MPVRYQCRFFFLTFDLCSLCRCSNCTFLKLRPEEREEEEKTRKKRENLIVVIGIGKPTDVYLLHKQNHQLPKFNFLGFFLFTRLFLSPTRRHRNIQSHWTDPDSQSSPPVPLWRQCACMIGDLEKESMKYFPYRIH